MHTFHTNNSLLNKADEHKYIIFTFVKLNVGMFVCIYLLYISHYNVAGPSFVLSFSYALFCYYYHFLFICILFNIEFADCNSWSSISWAVGSRFFVVSCRPIWFLYITLVEPHIYCIILYFIILCLWACDCAYKTFLNTSTECLCSFLAYHCMHVILNACMFVCVLYVCASQSNWLINLVSCQLGPSPESHIQTFTAVATVLCGNPDTLSFCKTHSTINFDSIMA